MAQQDETGRPSPRENLRSGDTSIADPRGDERRPLAPKSAKEEFEERSKGDAGREDRPSRTSPATEGAPDARSDEEPSEEHRKRRSPENRGSVGRDTKPSA